jgi:hypothetical protein
VAAGAATGYCSRGGCTDATDCPAGFACGGDGRCTVPDDCSAWLQTMGSACLDSDHCAGDLAGGWCERTGDAPGQCTAACVADPDCQVGTALAATMVCAPGGWCTLP